jgi:hypothetical protein
MRHGEHDVKVGQPEQLLFPGREPSLARLRLTLRAVTIATRNGELTIMQSVFSPAARRWSLRLSERLNAGTVS